MKEYESLQLEAARLERDAKRVHMENAVLEQVNFFELRLFGRRSQGTLT